jgi:3-isopropylmalate/(R)-2-methylmalate dehydratase large subunit
MTTALPTRPTVPGPARSGATDPDQTLAQRIIARASGKSRVEVGDVVWVDVDFAMIQDSGGPRRLGPALERLGARIWDVDRLTVVSDHYVPGGDIAAAEILKITREFAQQHGVERFHEAQGISHTLMVEQRYAHPGMLYIGGDSHSCTAGVLGCLALGMGTTDLLGVLATGQAWVRVPETVAVDIEGELPTRTSTKDVILRLIGERGMDGANYQVLQFGGSGLSSLNVDERSVLTNMCSEIGAKTGIIPADDTTWSYLREAGVEPVAGYEHEGAGAVVDRWQIAAAQIEPVVARPDTVDDVVTAASLEGTPVTRAYLGACTGAKYTDMRQAAEILEGRQVAPGVRMHLAPASRQALQRAVLDGTLSTLIAAGVHVLSTGCGACPGMGNGVLADGDVCISTTNRNFKGRMGSRESQVYLASAYTVAATAVTGRITDPREL